MPTKAKDSKLGCFEGINIGISWIRNVFNRIRAFYSSLNSSYIDNIHRHKILRILPPSLVILVLLCVMIVSYTIEIINAEDVLYNSQNNSLIMPTDPLYEGEITQEIPNNLDTEISSLSILFGTHERLNHADYSFSIAKNDEIIYTKKFSASSVSDNSFYRFNFPTIDTSDGEYSFSIQALKTDEKNAVSLYLNTESNEVIYKLGYKSSFYPYVIIISSIIFIFFCMVNVLINSGKIKTEFQFLAYALVYIVSLVFIYPACTIPDEQYHFLSAVRLAEYNFSETPSQNFSRLEINLPANSECLTNYSLYNAGRVSKDELMRCFSSAPDERKVYIGADNTTRSLAYLPAALGIKIGDLISNSPMVIFYFGRIFNLIAVSLIVVYALKLLKNHRMILLAVVMIPMFLQQAASYSYDGLLNSLCLVMIAYLIRFLTTEAKMRKRDIVVMALALAFIGLVKLPYIIIATPLIFVKTEKFGGRKWTKWLLLVGLVAISVIPYIIDSQIKLPEIYSATTDGRGLPLSSIFAAPLSTIKMLVRTIFVSGKFFIIGLIGYFGWFYFSLNPILIVAYLIFLLVVTLSSREVKLSKMVRFIMILISLAIIGSTFLIMYLSHTRPGSRIIEGVQGRYFLPIVPLLMVAFMPKKNRIDLKETTCYAFINLVMVCFLISLLIGFY